MAIARKFGDEVRFWNVPDVQAAAADPPITEIAADRFDLNVDAWFGEACEPTIANVVLHMRRIHDADLSEPIILSAEGHVLDGLNRLAKCRLEGLASLRAKQFAVNPPPLRTEPFEGFRRRKPRIAATLAWMETHGL